MPPTKERAHLDLVVDLQQAMHDNPAKRVAELHQVQNHGRAVQVGNETIKNTLRAQGLGSRNSSQFIAAQNAVAFSMVATTMMSTIACAEVGTAEQVLLGLDQFISDCHQAITKVKQRQAAPQN